MYVRYTYRDPDIVQVRPQAEPNIYISILLCLPHPQLRRSSDVQYGTVRWTVLRTPPLPPLPPPKTRPSGCKPSLLACRYSAEGSVPGLEGTRTPSSPPNFLIMRRRRSRLKTGSLYIVLTEPPLSRHSRSFRVRILPIEPQELGGLVPNFLTSDTMRGGGRERERESEKLGRA